LYGKHLAVPVVVGEEERIGALLIGREMELRDFDERDIQLATTLASQLAVATENQRLFAQAEGQRLTLQSTIEAMPAGVVVLSATGDVILTNQQSEDILGAGIRKELFGKDTYPIYQLGSDELYPVEQFPTTLAMQQQQSVSAENLYVKHPDGRRIDLLANAAPVLDEQSNVQNVVFVFQEITELRELELALQASLSETTALYEASRTVATVTSVDDLADALMGQIQNFAPDQFFVLVREGQDQGRFTTRIAGVWPPMEGDEPPQLPIPLDMLSINDTLLVEDTGKFRDDLEDFDPEFGAIIEKARQVNIQSFIIVPLKGRGNTILGWFTAIYHKGWPRSVAG
jgi:PAS domain S-box-containing protein